MLGLCGRRRSLISTWKVLDVLVDGEWCFCRPDRVALTGQVELRLRR